MDYGIFKIFCQQTEEGLQIVILSSQKGTDRTELLSQGTQRLLSHSGFPGLWPLGILFPAASTGAEERLSCCGASLSVPSAGSQCSPGSGDTAGLEPPLVPRGLSPSLSAGTKPLSHRGAAKHGSGPCPERQLSHPTSILFLFALPSPGTDPREWGKPGELPGNEGVTSGCI